MNSFRPHFPRGLFARPELIQVLVFAVSVHGMEEPVMPIGHELTFTRQSLQRFPFEDALRAIEVIEHAAIENKKTGTDQAIRLGFLHEALHLTLSIGFE